MGTRSVEFPANKPWIAVDWGTSCMRAWVVNGDSSSLIVADGPGMSQLKPAQFEEALLSAIEPHLPQSGFINVLACGMVGAKQGWIEAPYRATPCKPLVNDQLTLAPSQSKRISVYIVPGVSQTTPADVMRGEETLIAGLLSNNPAMTGLVCLPGTHCKWVTLNDGKITQFTTTMTGELFDLLNTQSILRNDTDTTRWDNTEFKKTITDIAQQPEQLTQALFSIRATSLLQGLDKAKGASRLSGLLIGCDVSSVMPQISTAERIVVVGQTGLAEHYQTALKTLGYNSTSQSMETLLLDGLLQLTTTLKG